MPGVKTILSVGITSVDPTRGVGTYECGVGTDVFCRVPILANLTTESILYNKKYCQYN